MYSKKHIDTTSMTTIFFLISIRRFWLNDQTRLYINNVIESNINKGNSSKPVFNLKTFEGFFFSSKLKCVLDYGVTGRRWVCAQQLTIYWKIRTEYKIKNVQPNGNMHCIFNVKLLKTKKRQDIYILHQYIYL